MTKEQQIKFFEEFSAKQKETLLKKGDDYANDDRLSNFKSVAQITKLKPETVALVLMGVKVARLGELLSGKEPKNESISDSILDLANYAALLGMIVNEPKDEKVF